MIYSGIENEHEILSCAQLEAQQEQLAKSADVPSPIKGASASESVVEAKIAKRVIGISDLKPIQKRFDNSKKKQQLPAIIGQQIIINPNESVKVNNFEIIARPRSVTASIFANTTAPTSQNRQEKGDFGFKEPPLPALTKTREPATLSVTAKLFRQNPQNVTSKIFSRRTEDMNKGFLMFSEDDTALTSEYSYLCTISHLPGCCSVTVFFSRDVVAREITFVCHKRTTHE